MIYKIFDNYEEARAFAHEYYGQIERKEYGGKVWWHVYA